MYPSLESNGFKQPKTSFFSNYNNDIINPSRTPEEHYFHPSPHYIPLEDEAIFCDFLPEQQFLSNDTIILAQEHSTMEECSKNNGKIATNDRDYGQCNFDTRVETENSNLGKRSSKRDRHSKINTARGPRDRRMRLSLDVAKKLFGLQDLLGYDKASKTVDWLITKSNAAIQELLPDPSYSFMGVSNSASSTSDCEVLSGIGDQPNDQATTKNKVKYSSGTSKKEKEKITRARRSANLHDPLAKVTREKARARARVRTMEKRNSKLGGVQDSNFRPCVDDPAIDQDVNRLGFWSPFEESQARGIDQPHQMSSNFEFKQGFVCDGSSLMMASNWSPSNLFGLTHEHQFSDFQINGRVWEGNNN